MKKFFPFVLVFLLLSCKFDDNLVLKKSTGKINSLVIVIENSQWLAKPGDALREILATPVLGLPQEEYQFSVSHAPVKAFQSIFKSSRNLLLVGYDSRDSFTVKKDLYASPQVVMTILGTNEAALIALINKHQKEIISVFKDADLKVYQKKLGENVWKNDSLKTLQNFGVNLKIPIDYRLVDDTGDFLWLRQQIERGSTNLIAYQIPYQENDSTFVDYITSSRDTIGAQYIPGPSDGSYMITEADYAPFITKTTIGEYEAYETRGKWTVKNDFMAGPFVSYTIVDKKNNRLVVVEGFTYAPNTNKRDYMFELEAIIKTLKI